MAIKNEISILTSAEQLDLYSPPIFSVEEQRGVLGIFPSKVT
jgi:hypothetical protein